MIETASFLAVSTFVQRRGAVAFVAQSVARHYEREGLFKVLPLKVPVDLPPVGLITVRGRAPTRITGQLMDCIRAVARKR